MIIETKFGPGDRVWIARCDSRGRTKACDVCHGGGRVKIEGSERTVQCPECFGRGTTTVYAPAALTEQMTVGQVRVSITDSPGVDGEDTFDNYKAQQNHEERYMCVETGVGSGTLWGAENLFSTQSEAQERAEVLLAEFIARQNASR